ncbi:hypothetical protein ACTXT7_007928 [Hymenolepis weldensis]
MDPLPLIFSQKAMVGLPIGVRCCQRCNLSISMWRAVIFIFTLYIYATFHASRKPISVVKSVLHPNCSDIARRENKTITPENATFCMWKPFDTDDYNVIFGYLDLSYLLSYALSMFFLGQVAERIICGFFQSSGWPAAWINPGFLERAHPEDLGFPPTDASPKYMFETPGYQLRT